MPISHRTLLFQKSLQNLYYQFYNSVLRNVVTEVLCSQNAYHNVEILAKGKQELALACYLQQKVMLYFCFVLSRTLKMKNLGKNLNLLEQRWMNLITKEEVKQAFLLQTTLFLLFAFTTIFYILWQCKSLLLYDINTNVEHNFFENEYKRNLDFIFFIGSNIGGETKA